MDYCIYKTINNEEPRVVHTFTQEATHSRALANARAKFREMFDRVATHPEQYQNLKAISKEVFTYEYLSIKYETVKVRFYIGQKKKSS